MMWEQCIIEILRSGEGIEDLMWVLCDSAITVLVLFLASTSRVLDMQHILGQIAYTYAKAESNFFLFC